MHGGDIAKKIKKKKSKVADSKSWDFQNRQFSFFFARIPGIGPWVSRINWCKGHWCGSTHIVRLSRVRSKTGKTGKKCIFCVFACFSTLLKTTWWPYRLSHINALHINLSYPHKTIPWSSCKKYWEFGGSENLSFFESAIMNFCFWFDFFFCCDPMKIGQNS